MRGVAEDEVGVASALFNAAQQIGAALGIAVFGSVATAASESRLPGAARELEQVVTSSDPKLIAAAGEALTHGYTTALLVAAALLLLAALVAGVAITAERKADVTEPRLNGQPVLT